MGEVASVRLRAKQTRPGYYSYEVTLPKDFVEKLGWKPGERLLVELQGDKLIIYRPSNREQPS